jgi:hypothetical protein
MIVVAKYATISGKCVPRSGAPSRYSLTPARTLATARPVAAPSIAPRIARCNVVRSDMAWFCRLVVIFTSTTEINVDQNHSNRIDRQQIRFAHERPRIRAGPERRIKLGQKNGRPYRQSPRSKFSVIHFSVNSLHWTPCRWTAHRLRQRVDHGRSERVLANPRNRSSGAIDRASIALDR